MVLKLWLTKCILCVWHNFHDCFIFWQFCFLVCFLSSNQIESPKNDSKLAHTRTAATEWKYCHACTATNAPETFAQFVVAFHIIYNYAFDFKSTEFIENNKLPNSKHRHDYDFGFSFIHINNLCTVFRFNFRLFFWNFNDSFGCIYASFGSIDLYLFKI